MAKKTSYRSRRGIEYDFPLAGHAERLDKLEARARRRAGGSRLTRVRPGMYYWVDETDVLWEFWRGGKRGTGEQWMAARVGRENSWGYVVGETLNEIKRSLGIVRV